MLAGLVQNPTANNPVRATRPPALAAAQRRAQPDGRARTSSPTPRPPRRKSEASTRRRSPSTINGCQGTDYPFLCDYVYRSLEQTPSLGATVEERQETDQARRSDGHDHVRSRHPGRDPGGGQRRRRPDRSGDRGDGHDRARHRADRGHGPEPAGDGRQRREGPDLLELLGVAGDGRRAGLPGRLDLQGLHRGRGAGAGHPAVQALQRRAARWTSPGASFETCDGPQPGLRQLAGQQLHRHQRRRWTCTGPRSAR